MTIVEEHFCDRTGQHTVSAFVCSCKETSCDRLCVWTWKIISWDPHNIEGLLFALFEFLMRSLSTTSRRVFRPTTYFDDALSADIFVAADLLHIFPEIVENLSDKGQFGEEKHTDHQFLVTILQRQADVNKIKESHLAAFKSNKSVKKVDFYCISNQTNPDAQTVTRVLPCALHAKKNSGVTGNDKSFSPSGIWKWSVFRDKREKPCFAREMLLLNAP